MTCEGASFFRFLSWLASPSRCEILRLVSLGRRNRGGHSPSHADVTSEQLRSLLEAGPVEARAEDRLGQA